MRAHSLWPDRLESLLLPLLALAGALLLFGGFVALGGHSAVQAWQLLFLGAFGDAFSWQNSLQRAAPLMLTGLCVALPAQAGLVVIGGEGALVLGGLAAAAGPYLWPGLAGASGSLLLLLLAAAAGGGWIALAGWMRQARGVNETISSLLLSYVAIAVFKHLVEGPLRDPSSLNKPSTRSVAESLQIGSIGHFDVHWGLLWGLGACVLAAIWLGQTTHGFATRVVGGNLRTARLIGLPTQGLVVTACALGGACAGLAGGIEVLAVHTNANASLIAGFGYTGILVSFVARHQPLAIIPVAILFGGFGAAGSLLQRRMGLPDASVQVLLGFSFVLILASDGLKGQLAGWLAGRARQRPADTVTPIPAGGGLPATTALATTAPAPEAAASAPAGAPSAPSGERTASPRTAPRDGTPQDTATVYSTRRTAEGTSASGTGGVPGLPGPSSPTGILPP